MLMSDDAERAELVYSYPADESSLCTVRLESKLVKYTEAEFQNFCFHI